MKKFYLKPEVEDIIEIPAVNIMEDSTGLGEDDGEGPRMSPRWKTGW